MNSKNIIKSLLVVGLFIMVSLMFSSCGFRELKQFGISLLTGAPVKSNDTQSQSEEMQTVGVIENSNNYYIKNDISSEAEFKYTVEKSYVINDLSDAGLSINDFFNSNQKTKLFTSDGKLIDENSILVCVELSVEKLSDRKNSFTGSGDLNVHILENMSLFSGDVYNSIGEDYYCIHLDQTEDITRSSKVNEYSYFSLKKSQTARFKLCFVMKESELEAPDICLSLGDSLIIGENSVDRKTCYIPLTIEGKK